MNKMNKRTSRHSIKLQDKKTESTEFGDKNEDPISKKLFSSSTKATIIKSGCEQSQSACKEPVKMTLKELKNLKNLRQNQEKILMTIENDNIQQHVQSLLEKFDPPNCQNCPNRNAEKVCINKECGIDKYMSLICGKCHISKHQKAINKPEIDIEEFFIKLTTFINEQKYSLKKDDMQTLDIDTLGMVFDEIDKYRQKLSFLKQKITNEVEDYSSPSEMHAQLQNNITKALSLCEYDNLQDQITQIKKLINFTNNKFIWNDSYQKYKTFSLILNDMEEQTKQTQKIIQNSIVGGIQIGLNNIQCLPSLSISSGGTFTPIQAIDGEIKIKQTGQAYQYYLDYDLEQNKKYKLRFRFTEDPSIYIMVGVMPKSQVQSNWVFCVQGEYFCKRFSAQSPSQECSNIMKGKDLNMNYSSGMKIEMRIDFENNYVDFYDYPDKNNINANHVHQKFWKEEHVIAFCFYGNKSLAIESLEEISSLEKLY